MRFTYRQFILFGILCLISSVYPTKSSAGILTGAEQFERFLPILKGKRVGLVVNQTSLSNGVFLPDSLSSLKINQTCIFTPEHGLRGTADAGETVSDGTDPKTGIKVISLYGKNKKPLPKQLNDIDIIIFDIQDVGARFYTYISTLYYVMQACAEQDKEIIILDRPNPCDYVDGPVLKPAYKSFVGMLPIPVLHGCTIGELALMINGEGWLGNGLKCRMKVITVKGWAHKQAYSLPVKPSPNLPNDQSVALYASLCPFEGTDISVGRGTEYPFQIIGSPKIKNTAFRFTPRALKGSDMNPLHKNQECYGKDLRQAQNPNGFSLKYIIEVYRYYKKTARNPEAEFFTRPKWFDLLMGTDQVRKEIIQGKTETEIRAGWQKDLEHYKKIREKYLLYREL